MSFSEDHGRIVRGETTERRLMVETLAERADYPSTRVVAAARGVVRAHSMGLEPCPNYEQSIRDEAPELMIFFMFVDDWQGLRRGGCGTHSVKRWMEVGRGLAR